MASKTRREIIADTGILDDYGAYLVSRARDGRHVVWACDGTRGDYQVFSRCDICETRETAQAEVVRLAEIGAAVRIIRNPLYPGYALFFNAGHIIVRHLGPERACRCYLSDDVAGLSVDTMNALRDGIRDAVVQAQLHGPEAGYHTDGR